MTEYWDSYNNLQRVKHQLVREYLNGWLPKLTLGQFGSKKVIYFDTHAGKGRHESGELGSPLIALSTVLNHRTFKQHNPEVNFYFIEKERENAEALTAELRTLEPLPPNAKVFVDQGECFVRLSEIAKSVKEQNQRLAPSFIFCDPFNFNVPFTLFRELMAFPRVEVFINVMWRELDMGISHAREGVPGWVTSMNTIFGSDVWKSIDAPDHDDRAEQVVKILRDQVGAKWATHIRMCGANGATRYFLLHLTKSDEGRDLMKTCLWKVCPAEGYFARVTDNPKQQYLIRPEPDLLPLRKWVLQQLKEGPKRWLQLTGKVRDEIWLGKHLNEVIRDLRNEGKIEPSDALGTGIFAERNSPILTLVGDSP